MKIIEKGWGKEEIWASNSEYCGKFLHFEKDAKCSMHFHKNKHETWYVLSGSFLVLYVDTSDATIHEHQLNVGDVWINDRLLPHQLICKEAGTIIEVSTEDTVEDNYRIIPGNSQL